jgi:dienelactone hydrolase/uncharacterized protein (DUF2141 family)
MRTFKINQTGKNRLTAFLTLPLLSLAFAGAALAQTQTQTVTVTVTGIASADGALLGQLCPSEQAFQRSACPLSAISPAKAGATDLTFANVPAGTYALQVFHDANSDNRPNFPAEGYAFGNDIPYPAPFDKAAIKVAGDTKASVKLIYMAGTQAATAPETGVAPPPGVIKTDVRADGLYGALYAPEGGKKLPVIIAIGGSEGGLNAISAISNSLATKGYAVLALAYWRGPGLPRNLEEVPLEYFDKAIGWVKTRPEADGGHIGMMGWSRGGEGALLIASHNREIRAVIALAGGSHVIVGINQADYAHSKPAWTLKGQPVPYFMPDMTVPIVNGNFRKMMDESHRDVTKHPEAEIPVEKINGPVLLLTGSEDGVWNAPAQAERVIARLKAKGFKPEARHIDYPGAGHLVFTGDPAVPSGLSAWQGFAGAMGGKREANIAAMADSWPKALAFFDKALKKKS